MYSQTVLLSVLVAIAEARFGQEQAPVAAIQAVTSGGAPGEAATLAGGSISTLLAAANPCEKLSFADNILAELGTGADAVAAARGLVGAEQNFNPFLVSIPSICDDPTLPVNPLLRGVIPLVDPAVGGSDLENAASKASLTTPLAADGLSVAQVMVNAGFSNFTTKDASGTVGTPGAQLSGASSGSAVVASSAVADVATTAAAVASSSAAAIVDCGGVTTLVTVTKAAASTAAVEAASTTSVAATAASSGAALSPAVGVNPGFQNSTLDLDFGLCTPTIKFEAGLDGRSDTEFTFQAIDPLVNKGQEEALNPNIITNRICDQLVNVCEASDAAHTACLTAKAQILALGTRDQSTADAWNTALGFAGTNTNPDNAPQAGLIGHD